MSNQNDRTAFQLGADALSKIIHPRRHSKAVEGTIADNRAFLQAFKTKIERAATMSGGESKAALSSLLDDAKFSDPISVAETEEDESMLISLADDFLSQAEKGEVITAESIDRAKKILSIRNKTCKRSK